MALMQTYAPGQFNWVDLMARDIDVARRFYCELFDWTAVDQQTGGPPYVIFQRGDEGVAGMGSLPTEQPMPSVWNSYVNVENVDETLAAVETAGGTVALPAMDVLTAGRMAAIQDPAGAFLFLWQARDHAGASRVNEPGSWIWNEVITPDPAAVQPFYSRLFDWTFEEDPSNPTQYSLIMNNGRRNGGVMKALPEMANMPSFWAVYFATDAIDASLESVTRLGGTICQPRMSIGVGHLAVVSDPQGAMFNLIQMTVPPDE